MTHPHNVAYNCSVRRPSELRLPFAVLLALGLAVACSTSDSSTEHGDPTTTAATSAAGSPEDFYSPPSRLDGKPGDLIRESDIDPAEFTAGAAGSRILYQSTNNAGEEVAVSGVVLRPDGDPPAGGWPIIAWAHGTTGVADECAPSRDAAMFGYATYVGDLVRSGFVVVASDYEGLGTPGPHPYLDKGTEGRNVIDSVAAARALLREQKIPTASDWVVVGHSQGGQAAMATAELSAEGNGSPPLAVVAIAPASNLPLLPDFLRGTPLQGYLAFAAAGIIATDPAISYDDLMGPISREKLDVLDNGCWTEVMGAYASVPADDTRMQTPAGAHAVERFLDINEPGTQPMEVPILLVQGEDDDTVPLVATELLRDRLCEAGEDAQITTYAGAGHDEVLEPSRADITEWIRRRLAKAPAQGCN